LEIRPAGDAAMAAGLLLSSAERKKEVAMNGSKRGMSGWMKAVRALAVSGGVGLVVLLTLGSTDRNAAGSHQRTSTRIESVRGSEASAAAAQADPGYDNPRVPGHSELDLQLD
jgi:hypothetical protein